MTIRMLGPDIGMTMFELLNDDEIERHDTQLSPLCYDITGLLQAQCRKDLSKLSDILATHQAQRGGCCAEDCFCWDIAAELMREDAHAPSVGRNWRRNDNNL